MSDQGQLNKSQKRRGSQAVPPPTASLTLPTPRSSSVQQLIYKCKVGSSSLVAPESSSSSKRESLPVPPIPVPEAALKAQPINAINGTLGPLDWTPKYGLGKGMQGTRREKLELQIRAEANPFQDPPESSQRRHIIPLRSLDPNPTIPSPGFPSHGRSTLDALQSSLSPPGKVSATGLGEVRSTARPTSRPATFQKASRIIESERNTIDPFAGSALDRNPWRREDVKPSGSRSPSPTVVREDPPLPIEVVSTSSINSHLAPSYKEGLVPPSNDDFEATLRPVSALSSYLDTRVDEEEGKNWDYAQKEAGDEVQLEKLPKSVFVANKERSPRFEEQPLPTESPRVSRLSQSSALPIPAEEVFATNAMPLHLPALEEYLGNHVLFAPSSFSDSTTVCTWQEKELFGVDRTEENPSGSWLRESKDKRRRSAKFEVAGGQINCPVEAYTSSLEGLRNRKGNYVKLEDEEKGHDSTDERPSAYTLSTASHLLTQHEMFPPLMLLKENSLDELKSNAIGPRKPPGGIWGVQILGTIFDFIIGAEGSNFATQIFRLEVFRDFFQIMAINLNFEKVVNQGGGVFDLKGLGVADVARKVLLQIIPSLLGLDFVSVFGYALIFFVIWVVITGLALWRFWRMTKAYDPNRNVEGFESRQWIYQTSTRGTKLMNTVLVFVLSTLYLPLSKLAVDALVWSSDFWPIENPYAGGQDHPNLAPLGDSDIWRDPLDFCYTTTMRRDGFNWAFVIVPFAAVTVLGYTLWYPFRMMMTIKDMLPHVSEYNELGKKRTEEEMKIEYSRLLNRDKSPLNFLYNAYRRNWGFYKPMYILFFKLSNLLIIGVFSKDNCLFRSFPTKTMLMVQQIVLIVTMSLLLGVHVYVRPFVDMISNRSEMVSRIGYVLTAVIGLLVALKVQGSTVYNTTLLYLIQAFSYTGNIYFAIIGTSFAAHRVKHWQNRVDFSLDIFSPLLDMQKHIKRRIWQETLSIILLCGKEYHMPLEHVIAFSMSDEDAWPPYLLDFQGSAAERHVENLKIVKEIGVDEYERQVLTSRTEEGWKIAEMVRLIQRYYAGVDAYYRPIRPPFPDGVSSFFGKAFVIPFPPTLVMRYDQGSTRTLQLTQLHDLEAFIKQNDSVDVRSKRMVRQGLRALEGQRILCPYVNNILVGGERSMGTRWWNRRPRTRPSDSGKYTMVTPTSYLEGTLQIERRQEHEWNGYNFASGFWIKIVYDQGGHRQEPNGALTMVRDVIEVGGSKAFGLHDDFEMTPSLARFFQDNEFLIKKRVPHVQAILERYRRDFEKEARQKERAMPYAFETDIFDNHRLDPEQLRSRLDAISDSRSLQELPKRYEGCITLLYERMTAINRSPIHRYWWLLFDEIWRLNSGDYKLLIEHRRTFSPQFPTSIAYTPMPRAELENLLAKYGLLDSGPFSGGLLNRIYFYLYEIVFAGHHGRVGLGTTRENATKRDYSTLTLSKYTGGGTTYSIGSVIDRSAYTWEQRMNGKPASTRWQRFKIRAMQWLNLYPVVVDLGKERLFLYVRLEGKRYVLHS